MKFSSGRWVIPTAILLYAAVFALRLLFPSPNAGISTLWLVPVVLLAVQYGVRVGVGAALVAIALSAIAAPIAGTDLPLLSYIPRSLGFVVVGAVTGAVADRLHRAVDDLEAGSRHFELSEDLLFTVDFGGRILNVNDSWERVMGWSREDLISTRFIELVHPDDRERTTREVTRAAVNSVSASIRNRYRTKSGSWRWIEWTTRADYEHFVVYAVGRDVTERRAAQIKSREAEERFRRVFDDSSAGMALVDMDGRVVEANDSLARILATDRASLIGVNTVTEFADRGEVPVIREGLERVMAGKARTFEREVRVKRYDDEHVWVQLTVSLIRDAEGKPLYRMSQVIDIDARKRAEKDLQRLADHDPLSGVYNRRRFEAELDREFDHPAQANRLSSVLLLDVDNFKTVNDTLGHAAGDRVIGELGALLLGRLRTGDVIGRLGGDEFAVLLRRTAPAEAEAVARGIQELVERDLGDAAATAGGLRVSIGVAHFSPEPGLEPDTILARADQAMYEAKGRGGNQVVVRDPELTV